MPHLRQHALQRFERVIELPRDVDGNPARISQYFGENCFDVWTADEIPEYLRSELEKASTSFNALSREHADAVAQTAMNWALSKGATHFCHWFQPLTGHTAEKHDAFIDMKDGHVIENLSAAQLMQGEPDASSFPHGGSRSTFEARGYTAWDLTSPMFLMEGSNGKTLCIPTAFVSYTGDALDMKTPLLRAESRLSTAATKFLHAIGLNDVTSVKSTCGPEQEYFLIDRAFYYARPDLVMTGRTLIGSPAAKHQQLEDHYFGEIPERVIAMMQELDLELHRLGIPAKTRHNEVAPGQYEITPIFQSSNRAADSNQILMVYVAKVARKHNFVALFHEKPFQGINGSGKHLNWSMSTNTGVNLLNPGKEPRRNKQFLAVLACILEAMHRHGDMIRAAVASAGNDHRLGANEAPPSIMSCYVGDHLKEIIDLILADRKLGEYKAEKLEIGAKQLASLAVDNTDRNRTSPFAFTGNRFELRVCGSDAAISFPLAILNSAVADIFDESTKHIGLDLEAGLSLDEAVVKLTKKWFVSSQDIVFNGDGYSKTWAREAEKRSLSNFRNTPEALPVLKDEHANAFLRKAGVFTGLELETRYRVLTERYCTQHEIEFRTLNLLVYQHVLPSVLAYKNEISTVIRNQKSFGMESSIELDLLHEIDDQQKIAITYSKKLADAIGALPEDRQKRAEFIADELTRLTTRIGDACNRLEELVSDKHWSLPKFADMLFLR